MNTLEKHVAMLSLKGSLYKGDEKMFKVVDYFVKIDQSNLYSWDSRNCYLNPLL